MAAKLDSRHHTFLQAIMNRGPLSDNSAVAMYKSLFRIDHDEGFVQFLGAINKELEYVQMEVKKVLNQYDGKGFYGIINTLPSKEAKLGTRYTQAQILFFTAVMEAIVQEPSASGVISSNTALWLRLDLQGASQPQNTSSQAGPVKMSMQAKEEALSLLASDQMLIRTAEGGVGLGVKAFLELRTIFRNLEVPFCEVCNEAAIKAQLCSNEQCPVRIHSYCLARKFQTRIQRPKCSTCGTPWSTIEEDGNFSEGELTCVIPIASQELMSSPKHEPEPEPTQRTVKRPRSRLVQKAVVRNDMEESIHQSQRETENSPPNVSVQNYIRRNTAC